MDEGTLNEFAAKASVDTLGNYIFWQLNLAETQRFGASCAALAVRCSASATAVRLQCITTSADRLLLWSDASTDALPTYTTRAAAGMPPRNIRQKPGDTAQRCHQ